MIKSREEQYEAEGQWQYRAPTKQINRKVLRVLQDKHTYGESLLPAKGKEKENSSDLYPNRYCAQLAAVDNLGREKVPAILHPQIGKLDNLPDLSPK